MPVAVPFAMGAVLTILLTSVLLWPRLKGTAIDRETALGNERERLIPYLPGDTVTGVDIASGVIEGEWFVDE